MTTTPETRQGASPGATPTQRRLYRSPTQKLVGGVCGGLGEYFDLDPVWFRIGFVLLAFGGGSGILIYLLMWLIVQPRPEGYTDSTAPKGSVGDLAAFGLVLIFVGTITFVNTVAPWLGQYFWPIIFVVGGLALIMGGVRNDTD